MKETKKLKEYEYTQQEFLDKLGLPGKEIDFIMQKFNDGNILIRVQQ